MAQALDWMILYPGSISLLIADLAPGSLSGPVLADWVSERRPGMKILLTVDHTVGPAIKNAWN